MKHVMRISYVALTACIAASALTHTAMAQSVKSASVTEAGATLAYWTPERLKSAKPKVLTTTQTFTPSAAIAGPTGPTTAVGGAPPTLRYNPSWAETLYVPEFHPESERGPVPESVGTSHYPYTIDRLYPTSGAITSNIFAFYPYEIVGQLYFTEPGGNFVAPRRSSASA